MTLSSHYSTHYHKSQYFLGFFAGFLAILSVIFASFSAFAASSSTQNFYFEDFTADYYLTRDADGISHMRVKERLTAIFPETDQNHGLTRIIPFTNNDGQNLTMKSTSRLDIVATRNGEAEPIASISSEDGYFAVQIGDAKRYVHGRQVYTLEYEFENLILDQNDNLNAWQELYWDANGNDWPQRFDRVTARVHLDNEIFDSFTAQTACYVGRYGASGTSRCQISKEGDVITFTATKLSSRENLTFVLGFAADTFTIRTPQPNYLLVIILGIFLIFGAGMLIFLCVVSRRIKTKRDYYRKLFIKPEYTAPRDFTVAEMAENYIGKGLKGNPKVATLLELAVTHKIELVKTEATGLLGKKKTVWQVHVLKVDNLSTEQTKVLQILNGSNSAISNDQRINITTHTANSTLEKLAQDFVTQTKESLKQKGLYIKKSAKKSAPGAGLLILLDVIWFFATIGAFFISIILPEESYLPYVGADWIPCLILPFGMILFTFILVKATKISKFEEHTEKGLDYARYLDGLKLYISMAEAERLKFLQSVKGADTSHQGVVKLYEKLLPYAALFGLEKSWLNELSRYYDFDDVASPTWYVGIGAFSAHDFSSAMHSLTSTAGTTITHSTTTNSSSGGSGFSGGFSGGGGGGGGGGGW